MNLTNIAGTIAYRLKKGIPVTTGHWQHVPHGPPSPKLQRPSSALGRVLRWKITKALPHTKNFLRDMSATIEKKTTK